MLEFRCSLALFIRWVGERLCYLGKQVNINIGLLIFDIIGIGLNDSFPSLERNVMNNVFLSKYVILSLLTLLILLKDGMFGFMWRPEIGIGVAIIIVLGIGIPGFQTSFQYDFATLVYVMARSLMSVSFILKQTEWDWLSHLMAGAAYACVTLGFVGYSISFLPFDYACVGVFVLFFIALFTWVMKYFR